MQPSHICGLTVLGQRKHRQRHTMGPYGLAEDFTSLQNNGVLTGYVTGRLKGTS